MNQPRWRTSACWPAYDVLTTTNHESKDTLTTGKLLDMRDRINEVVRDQIATEARAEPGTIALLLRLVQEYEAEHVSPYVQHGPVHFQGIPIREDRTVPPRVVRFHDRHGAVISEVAIGAR